MTTTTRKTLETDKFVGELVADPAVEQQGKAMDEAAVAGGFPWWTVEAHLGTRRGRQRTPKSWLMGVLCRLGMHDGRWAYIAEGSCTQGRECGRSGSVHVRTKHQREWRYKLEGSCFQIRVCARCADVNKTRTQHEKWGPTYSVDSDTDAHDCLRCGEMNSWSTASDGD